METYTKLTCEIKGPGGDTNSVTILTDDWAVHMSGLFEMMESLALALTYSPDTVNEFFHQDEHCATVKNDD